MSIEKVKEYFAGFGIQNRVMEFSVSSATVEQAAIAVGVMPAQIAKTLSFKRGGGCFLVVASGDAKIDNKKFKEQFGLKAKMLTPDEAQSLVGHPVGGICPFAIPDSVEVYLDISMQRFDTVFPACGSASSAIGLTSDELFKFSNAAQWVDVCGNWSV